MKAPTKPGSDFAKQYGAVERGNRTAQPPNDEKPRPKANPRRGGLTTSPRPQPNPRKSTPKGPAKPRNV